ncbi:MAG: hypothetical protein QOF10_483 [Kribbellaceae bacterium]|nr:hypothetical protein [Kribbellaceae bacterium]
MSAGPLSVPAEVLEYDELWPAWFEQIRARLEPYLGDLPHQIERVGRTAVPGLAAKPIIDIDVVVPTIERFPSAIAALVAGGYKHDGDLGIGREAFQAPADAPHYHHLYVVVAGSKPHQDHVALRDHLRGNPDDRARYAARRARGRLSRLSIDRSARGGLSPYRPAAGPLDRSVRSASPARRLGGAVSAFAFAGLVAWDEGRVDVVEDGVAVDHDTGDVVAARHLVHHGKQDLLEDRPQ